MNLPKFLQNKSKAQETPEIQPMTRLQLKVQTLLIETGIKALPPHFHHVAQTYLSETIRNINDENMVKFLAFLRDMVNDILIEEWDEKVKAEIQAEFNSEKST